MRTLSDGTQLRLSTDPAEVDAVIARFRLVMVSVGAGGLLLGAAALLVAVARSLRPLESMTEVARAITGGDRRRRLRPSRADTEIGRTAAAFDEMLDALEDARVGAEASAREARAAADEARRSEATTRRFLADAAHELRTPLAGTQALAETLLAEPDEDREELTITLVREASRAATLVSDMLDLARIEEGPVLQRRRVDLRALAAERAENTRSDQAVGVVGDALVVDADPCRVGQILDNLLANARRHTPTDGTITVTVAGDDDGGGTGATVTVRNTGQPVGEADRERIFDRLVRLDDARTRDAGGAGLGLAIARALARAHGGDLTYRDVPDGAAFVLTLPSA